MRWIVRLMRDGTFELDLDYFTHHSEEMPYQWENAAPQAGDLFSPALEELLGPHRRPEDA
jgi:carbamoyltransferase